MKMTATSSVFNFGLVLSLVCLGTVFVGGWYFQPSLVGLQTQMMTKIEVQAEMIQQLKETVMEQSTALLTLTTFMYTLNPRASNLVEDIYVCVCGGGESTVLKIRLKFYKCLSC